MDVVSKQRNRVRALGLAVVAAFVGYSIFAIYADDEPVNAGAWVYVAIAAVIAAGVWLFAVSKALRRETGNTPAKIGLVLGILAILAVAVFWSGAPALLGGAAFVLGREGAQRAVRGEGRAGMSKAATILGAIGIAVFAVTMIAWAVSELT